MSKPFIVTGLDGLIINSDIFSKAHEAWFDHYSKVLSTDLRKLMHTPDYWEAVFAAMENTFGLSRRIPEQKKLLQKFAREVYREYLFKFAEEYRQAGNIAPGEHGKCIEVFKALKSQDDRIDFGLLTTAPLKDSHKLFLEKLGCCELFNTIFAGALDEYPSAKEVFQKSSFAMKPICYIGTGKKTIEFFKEEGVPTILTYWHAYLDGYKGSDEAADIADYVVTTADQVKDIIENRILKPSQ